jgi:NADPH:quinone reductase-like Zn-dependent oxidoreductase
MARTSADGPIIDWEAVSKVVDLTEVVRVLPAKAVIEAIGVERAIQAILDTVGVRGVIDACGEERVLGVLRQLVPVEQLLNIACHQSQRRSLPPSSPALPPDQPVGGFLNGRQG